MQFSTALISSTLVALSVAASIPSLNARQSTETVSSDTGTVQIEVPAETDSTGGGGAVSGGADVAGAVADVVGKVVKLVQGMIDNDIKKRQAFTQNTAARARAATGKNVIVSNVGYKLDSTDKTVVDTSFNQKVGSDVTFDVIAMGKGTFELQGDGGFENWAYVVDGTCTVAGGKITC